MKLRLTIPSFSINELRSRNLFVLVIPVMLLIIFSGWLRSCYPYQFQYSPYQYNIKYIINSLNTYGFIPFWSSDWYNGFPFLLFYPPLFFIAGSIISLILRSTVFAQNIVSVLSFCFLPVSFYIFLRSFLIPRKNALMSSIIFITSHTILMLFVWEGISVLYLGLCFAFLGWSCINGIKDYSSFFKFCIYGVLVLLTHSFVSVFYIFLSLIFGLFYGSFRRVCAGLLVSFLISCFWFYPFLVNLKNAVTGVYIGIPDTFLVDSLNFLTDNIALMVFLGLSVVFLLINKNYKRYLHVLRLFSCLITSLFFSVFFGFFINPAYKYIFWVTALAVIGSVFICEFLSRRLIIYFLIAVFLIYLINPLIDESVSINYFELILSFTFLSLIPYLGSKASKFSFLLLPVLFLLFSGSLSLVGNPNMACYSKFINYNFSGRVFAFPYSQGEFLDLLPELRDVKISGGGFDQVDFRRGLIYNVSSPLGVYDSARIIGADYLLYVVRSPYDFSLLNKINKSSYFIFVDNFKLGIRTAYLFSVVNKTGYTYPLVNYSVVNPEEFVFYTNFTLDTDLLIRETFYPYWIAYINGSSVPVIKTSDSFMSVRVPKGVQELRLRYDVRREYFIGMLLSILGIVLLILLKRKKFNDFLFNLIPAIKFNIKK